MGWHVGFLPFIALLQEQLDIVELGLADATTQLGPRMV